MFTLHHRVFASCPGDICDNYCRYVVLGKFVVVAVPCDEKPAIYAPLCCVSRRHRFRYFSIWPDEDDSEADATLKHTSTILLRAPRELQKRGTHLLIR